MTAFGTVRSSKARTHPEDDLQQAIVRWHRDAVQPGWCVLFAVPNGEKRDPITAARLTGITEKAREALPEDEALSPFGLGVLPGVTDLVLVLPGARVVWIELKIPRITWPPAGVPWSGKREVKHEAGRLSKNQKRFEAAMQRMGHEHRVIRYLGEYADLLVELGVPLRRPMPWGPGVRPPAEG